MIFSSLKENKFSLFIVFMTSLFLFQTYAQTITGSFESKFKRYKKNQPFTGAQTQQWSTVAWKGERINKQIVLWSNTSISNITYIPSELTNVNGSIPSSKIELSFGKYVKGDPEARNCKGYPNRGPLDSIELIDALSDDEINSLTPLEPLINFWITINVPTTTVPGTYRGNLTVREEGGTEIEFSIELNVVGYTLPDVSEWSFHLDLWQFPVSILDQYNVNKSENTRITIWSDEHFALFKPSYVLLADTGQKVITTYIKDGALGAESMIKWIKNGDTWTYDFDVFEKYVDSLTSWGITKQISCFSPVGWNEETLPYWEKTTDEMGRVSLTKASLSTPLHSDTYAERWKHFLTDFKGFLDRKGWFDKTVLYLDEVDETKLTRINEVVNGDADDVGYKWKLGIAYSHGLKTTTIENFYDLSRYLGTSSKDNISDETKKSKITTFYNSCSNIRPNSFVTPENKLEEMTWIGWHSLQGGYDGYLRWAYDYWRLSDPLDARDGIFTAGDFFMIYRGSRENPFEILNSLRLMMLREGIQDFEKIKILRKVLGSNSEAIISLNTIIDAFTDDSGQFAERYIKVGQTKLAEISKMKELGIEDVKSENGNVVFPTLLTKDKSLILYLPEAKGLKTEFFLFNIIGQIVYKKEYNMFSGEETIDIQDLLVNGIYIVKVVNQEKSYTQKIVIAD